jgi:hypothetical protein
LIDMHFHFIIELENVRTEISRIWSRPHLTGRV